MNNNQLVAYFRGLADEVRLEILDLLAQHNELSVTPLTVRLNLPQPTVSKHLAAMRTSGVVVVRREGSQRFYRLHESNAEEVRRYTGGLVRRDRKAHQRNKSRTASAGPN